MKYISEIDKSKSYQTHPVCCCCYWASSPTLALSIKTIHVYTHTQSDAESYYYIGRSNRVVHLNKVDGGHKITITFSDYIWEFDITYIARSTIYTHKMMLYICGAILQSKMDSYFICHKPRPSFRNVLGDVGHKNVANRPLRCANRFGKPVHPSVH